MSLGLVPQRTTPPRRFDRDTWNQLSSIDVRLLDALGFLSRCTAKRSPTGALYAIPGRRWLAKHLGCSVETITRHTTKLRDLGLLKKLQRRPVTGQWQTCLYRLVHPMAWAAAAITGRVTRLARRLSFQADKASPLKGRENVTTSKESLRDVIARGLAKFGPPLAT